MAVVLLVSYHVIGDTDAVALQIGYPHLLRLYADFFIDVRMPFFAFIAGYVYALRPMTLENCGAFLSGKFRRLYIPGAVAIIAFAGTAQVMGTRFAVPLSESWIGLTQSYAHFWFLQAILAIFVLFGFLDAVLREEYSVTLFVIAVVLSLSSFHPGAWASLNGAVYLFPYFMLGVVFCRYAAELWTEADKLTIVLMLVAVICALWNIKILYETGVFSPVRRDLQSLGLGLSLCALAVLWCPRLPMIEALCPFAFTIYLYHVFGTVAARKALDHMGATTLEVRFLIGLMAGILLPVLLHLVCQRARPLSRLVLGR
jgi:hypothetical protein